MTTALIGDSLFAFSNDITRFSICKGHFQFHFRDRTFFFISFVVLFHYNMFLCGLVTINRHGFSWWLGIFRQHSVTYGVIKSQRVKCHFINHFELNNIQHIVYVTLNASQLILLMKIYWSNQLHDYCNITNIVGLSIDIWIITYLAFTSEYIYIYIYIRISMIMCKIDTLLIDSN